VPCAKTVIAAHHRYARTPMPAKNPNVFRRRSGPGVRASDIVCHPDSSQTAANLAAAAGRDFVIVSPSGHQQKPNHIANAGRQLPGRGKTVQPLRKDCGVGCRL
jgi:hypothetical protein